MRGFARLAFGLTALSLTMSAGCGNTELEYFAHLIGGTLQSYTTTRPVTDVIADGSVTEEQADKLRLVLSVREFARDVIGLNVGDSYSQFQNDDGNSVGWAVSASRKDALESYSWYFPFIGEYDAKGFYDLEMAKRESDWLMLQGYDVFFGAIAGFSTLGILADPVRASNLKLDDADLADLIVHETLHNTVFKLNDTNFNERMATFVGRTGAEHYYRSTYGDDAPETVAARERFADLVVIDHFVVELFDRLTAFYAQPITSEEKIEGRESVFEEMRNRFDSFYSPQLNAPEKFTQIRKLVANNATVLAGVRYQGGLDTFQQVFDLVERDYAAFLDVMRDAVNQTDSDAYLSEFIASHQP